MTIYLHASPRGSFSRATSSFPDAHARALADYGDADPALRRSRLNLNLCGKAFRDITGWGSLPFGVVIHGRDFVDLWPLLQNEVYTAGRGYPEWVWASAKAFLEVVSRGAMNVRLLV